MKTGIFLALLIASAANAQPLAALRSDAVMRDQVKVEQARVLHQALQVRLASLRH